MTFNLGEINVVLGIFLLAALSFIGAAYWRGTAAKEKIDETEAQRRASVAARLVELEAQMRILGIAVQPITAAMSAVLVKQLTHYHTPDTDALLAKVGPPNTLTAGEEKLLKKMLEARTKDMATEISESERNAAQLLPLIIERVRLERDESAVTVTHKELALVGLPKAHE